MLTVPEIFKAGYAGAPGALDEDALINEPDMSLLADNPAGHAAGSNLALAGRLVGPLRIMHGTADVNAPLSGSMRLTDALIRAGKPVELLTMPAVDHNPEGLAGDYYRDDVIRFFIRTLSQKDNSGWSDLITMVAIRRMNAYDVLWHRPKYIRCDLGIRSPQLVTFVQARWRLSSDRMNEIGSSVLNRRIAGLRE